MVVPLNLESLVAIIDLFANILIHTCYEYASLLTGRGTVTSRYEVRDGKMIVGWPMRNKAPPDQLFVGLSAAPCQSSTVNDTQDMVLWQESASRISSAPYIDSKDEANPFETYEKYIRLAKKLKASMLGMSLSWSVIAPDGFGGTINEEAIYDYDDLITEMMDNDITPMITLFHEDTPDPLTHLGGWTNPLIVEWFEAYARFAFAAFGDKVKYWVTIHDPVSYCLRTFEGESAEKKGISGSAVYLCGHHLLLAHVRVYKLYQEQFQWKQKGHVGVIQNFRWFEPESENSFDDIMGARVAHEWYNAWLMNPLFHNVTDYPTNMKDRIEFKSRYRNFPKSRLPAFTAEQMHEMKGAADFLGIDFHAAKRVRGLEIDAGEKPGFNRDADISIVSDVDQGEPADIGYWPRNLRKLLYRLNIDLNLPGLFIMRSEGNCSFESSDGLAYHIQNESVTRELLEEGAPIYGYFKWIIHDNRCSCSETSNTQMPI